MDRLIAGVMIFALALLLPIGIAIAADWQPGQTHDLITGLMTICGGAVALMALGVGLAVGIGLTRERDATRRANSTATHTHTVEVAPQRNDLAYWRQQRAMIEAQRAAVALERDRRHLATPALPAPQDENNYGWTFTQLAEMHDWVDAE